MSDKVQLIKQEVKKRISQFEAKYPKDLGGYWNDEEYAAYNCAEEYKRFLQFIDSLQEEPASEDLEEVAYNYAQQHNELLGFDCDCEPIQTGPEIKKAVIFGAEWYSQQIKEGKYNSE